MNLRKEAKVRQPKEPFRSLPANSLHISPSGSGKSLTLLRTLMVSDKLGGMFDKYLVLSPNIFVDPQYEALIKNIEKTTGQKKEEFCSKYLFLLCNNFYISLQN